MAPCDREEQQADFDADDGWVLLRNRDEAGDDAPPGEQDEGKTVEKQGAAKAQADTELTEPDRERHTSSRNSQRDCDDLPEPEGPLDLDDLCYLFCCWETWPLVRPMLPTTLLGLDLAIRVISTATLYSGLAQLVYWVAGELRAIRNRHLYPWLASTLVLLLNALLFTACIANVALLLRGIAEMLSWFLLAGLLATYESFSKHLTCALQGPNTVRQPLLDSCPTSPNVTTPCWGARLYVRLAESENGHKVEAMYEFSEGSFVTFMVWLSFAAGVFSLVLTLVAKDAVKREKKMYAYVLNALRIYSAHKRDLEPGNNGAPERVVDFSSTSVLQFLADILVPIWNPVPKRNAKCAASSRRTDLNPQTSRTPNAAEVPSKDGPLRRERHRRRRAVKDLRGVPGHRSAQN
ncbi:uncharacterized protein LOC125947287 [Dermacentor silvarum]|uniref:uncharacterized protein LOC125947287 n=1 Tax=Dermacentor silvarum TaxID=543639 RepID=UPI0021019846|nr:uncharacterized protein LOC125947287 [Dermacentor silvarum]